MRFEHDMRSEYENDHEEFEADLPDDLVLMGEQLFDDAEHLCEKYPTSAKTPAVASAAMAKLLEDMAGQSNLSSWNSEPQVYTTPVSSLESPRESELVVSHPKGLAPSTRRWTAIAALVLCAVGTWAYQSSTFQQNAFPIGADETAHGDLSSQLAELLPSHGGDLLDGELLLLSSESETPPSISTAEFESISSSEQEAVLDLLEDGGMLQASLSM